VQILQLCIIRCLALLATAKNGIGLIKQLFLLILDLILVYVKLLGKFRQRLVAFDRGQRHFRLEPRQMVTSFASHFLLLWWLKLPQDCHLCSCLRSGVHF